MKARKDSADIHRFLEIVLASLDRDGWLCGTHGGIGSPGLMTASPVSASGC
jgi:hypothetical protein